MKTELAMALPCLSIPGSIHFLGIEFLLLQQIAAQELEMEEWRMGAGETRTVPVLNFMRFNFLVRQIHLNMARLN